MKFYKLTDANGQTKNNTQWGEGVTHAGTGEGPLCGPGWIHFYTDPLLAVLLNPIHGNFQSLRLWETEGEVGARDHGLKVGCKSATTIREIPVPIVRLEQRIRFGILCAKRVYGNVAWNTWADKWLSGEDRGSAAARAAEEAAWAAEAAAWAAWAAAWAAWAAARAAEAAAEEAAEAAAAAAEAAAWAAAAPLDLAAIAAEAMRGEKND